MTRVKTLLILAVAAVGVSFPSFARAQDAKPMTGTLIDNMCGDKKKDEADAAKHTAACAKKDGCAETGYQVIVGDKHYKLDDKGNEMAKEYLKEHKGMKVTVDGKAEGQKLEVTSIKEAEKEEAK
jgi:hypothetical protein